MFKRIYDNLIAEYVKRTGKKPEGIDLLKLKLQAQEEARQAAKVVEFKPRKDSPYGKPGGWMPTKEEAEGIMSRLSSDIKNIQKQAQELKEMGGKGDTLDFMIDYFGLDPNIKKGKTKAGKINYEEMQKKFPSVELFGDESFDELLEIEKTGVHPRKNKSRLLTDDEIEDYSEILGDTETWMDKGTVEEAEAAVKRQKDYEQQMYSEYQVEKQGRKELEDAYKEIDFRMTGEDTKYEANELADMIAETRFKTEMSDLPQNTQLDLYDEAYNYLMELKRDAANFKGAVNVKTGKNIVTGEQEFPIDPMTGKPRKPNAKGGRVGFAQGANKKMMIVDLLNKGADFDLIKTITGASDEEIMEAVDFFKYGGAEVPLPTFDDKGNMIDDGLYKGRETRPEAKAYGGRIKLKKGGLSHILGV